MALLSAARNKKDRDLSQKIFNRIEQLFPHDKSRLSSASILLCNVYASIGDFENSTKIRNKLIHSGLKKRVGVTWTETNGQIFVSDCYRLKINKRNLYFDRNFVHMIDLIQDHQKYMLK